MFQKKISCEVFYSLEKKHQKEQKNHFFWQQFNLRTVFPFQSLVFLGNILSKKWVKICTTSGSSRLVLTKVVWFSKMACRVEKSINRRVTFSTNHLGYFIPGTCLSSIFAFETLQKKALSIQNKGHLVPGRYYRSQKTKH